MLDFTEEEQHHYHNMRRKVKREIAKARKEGKTWTTPRPFVKDSFERIGAMRCGRHPSRPSTHVSYSTAIDGRTAYCEECARRMGARVEKPEQDEKLDRAKLRKRIERYWEKHIHTLTNEERISGFLDELTHAVMLKTDAGAIDYLRHRGWADPVTHATDFRRVFKRPRR